MFYYSQSIYKRVLRKLWAGLEEMMKMTSFNLLGSLSFKIQIQDQLKITTKPCDTMTLNNILLMQYTVKNVFNRISGLPVATRQ